MTMGPPTATALMAQEMVRLEEAIKEAARGNEWIEAMHLDDTRWEVQQQRSRLMRDRWATRRAERQSAA